MKVKRAWKQKMEQEMGQQRNRKEKENTDNTHSFAVSRSNFPSRKECKGKQLKGEFNSDLLEIHH